MESFVNHSITFVMDSITILRGRFNSNLYNVTFPSGVGSALLGWFLELGGYVGSAATQTAGALSMIQFLYVIVPTVLALVMIGLLSLLTVEKANKTWDEEHK